MPQRTVQPNERIKIIRVRLIRGRKGDGAACPSCIERTTVVVRGIDESKTSLMLDAR